MYMIAHSAVTYQHAFLAVDMRPTMCWNVPQKTLGRRHQKPVLRKVDGNRVECEVRDAHSESQGFDQQPHGDQCRDERSDAENDQNAHCSMRSTPFVETLHQSARLTPQKIRRTYLRMLSKKLAKSASWIINHRPNPWKRSLDQSSSPPFTINSVSDKAVTC